MKILYLGSFVDKPLEELIWREKMGIFTSSATTFQRALLNGFNEYHKIDYIINAPDIGSFPLRFKKRMIPLSQLIYNGVSGINCSFCNITYIKGWSINRSIFKELDKYIKERASKDEPIIILVYSLIYRYIKAAVDIRKKHPNVKVCCIVADLPEYFSDNNSIIHKAISQLENYKITKIIPDIDSFILLTKEMSNALKVGQRPTLLLEGIYTERNIKPLKKEKKTILYTGNLELRFGIDELLEAFTKIKDPEFRLWICGDGLGKKNVEKFALTDNRITYFGRVKQETVFEMQHKATILINPRASIGEYTKYSFPSKTMEYMASGTPTVMYKLPGIPDEYNDFLILIDNFSSMEEAIFYWCNKNQEELDLFGKKSKEFILKNKNSNVQAKRILNFLHEHHNE